MFLLWSRKKLARCADLCVLPNEKRVEKFKEQTATSRPVICVWNCPSRDEAIVQPEKSVDELILFYHGSIVPDRLPVSVIYALANLPSSVRLRIAGYETVGHSGYVRELEEFANSRELGPRFEYLGSLSSRQALLQETRKAHVGLTLMPIKAMDLNLQAMTGASNKPFEYMACGLALLVSDLPDWSEMFVDFPGFARACDPQDPESIASALRWFIENPVKTRNMGERGRKQVLDEWNYETQFESVSRALESV
jgi:glycosyltransferase involved in cell wall biosynthesis